MIAPLTGVQFEIDRALQSATQKQEHRARVRQRRFDTIAVHGVYDMHEALTNQGSMIEPAYLSSAQHFENSDQMEAALAYQIPAWVYSRIANPTVNYLEQTLALLEGYGSDCETSALATSSGASAVFMATNPFLTVESGKPINIVVSAKCYGGTFMLFSQRYAHERGIEVRWVRDPLDTQAWARLVDDDTRFVYGEMPSNPTLGMFDIAAVAQLAHAAGIPLIVDSTIATPALLRPLEYGADIVIHSLSKAMSASGFVIAGAVISRRDIPSKVGSDEMRADFAMYTKLQPFRDHGPTLSPMNALLALNDLRTLRYRMDFFSQNTLKVACFLENHPNVEQVFYPGLESMPEYTLARRYLRLVDHGEPRYSHLMSFTVRGGAQAARKVFDRLQIVWRGTDLGKYKSVATIPTISTHQQQGATGRDLAAIPPYLIRLSVGAEHPDDLIDDLDQAL